MSKLPQKQANIQRRKLRIRSVVSGSPQRPRLSVSISNHHVTAQLIDDDSQRTIVAISTVGQKNSGDSLTNKASWAGSEIAKRAKSKKVNKVVLDRNGRLYHGRIKALADAARAEGLEF